jgi:hypothetical protein
MFISLSNVTPNRKLRRELQDKQLAKTDRIMKQIDQLTAIGFDFFRKGGSLSCQKSISR